MRGIGALMPWTKWAFLAGALALVGLPPFSGFFSKDAIIAAALHDHWYGVILALAGLAGAFLTGLYTFRLYFIVFPGKPSAFVRASTTTRTTAREGRWTMLVPVGILAVLAVIGGWIQFSPFWHPVTNWLEPAARTLGVAEPTNTQEAIASVAAVLLGLAGVGVAYALYGRRSPSRCHACPRVQRALEHKLYFDEAYDALFYRPAAALADWLRTRLRGAGRARQRPGSRRDRARDRARRGPPADRASCAPTCSSSAPAWRSSPSSSWSVR